MRSAYITKSISSATVRALNYIPELEAFRKRGDSKDCIRLGDLISGLGKAYGSVFIRYDCGREYGEELLTQSDIFADEPKGRIIRGDVLARLEEHRIYRVSASKIVAFNTEVLNRMWVGGRPRPS